MKQDITRRKDAKMRWMCDYSITIIVGSRFAIGGNAI